MEEGIYNKKEYAAEVESWLAHRANELDRERHEHCLELLQQRNGSLPVRPSTSLRFRATQPGGKLAPRSSSSTAAGAGGLLCTLPVRPASAMPERWLYNGTMKGVQPSKLSATAAIGLGCSSEGSGTCADAGSNRARPQTAAAGTGSNNHGSSSSSRQAHVPIELRVFRPATAHAAGGTSSSQAPPLGSNQDQRDPLAVSTTQASYGLKDLYPDLWTRTVPICRPDPAPNKNFVSEWGESLREGADEAWKPYLGSTYEVTNEQVYAKSDDYKVRREQALAAWVAKQRMYSSDILEPDAAEAVQQLLTLPPGAGEVTGPAREELINWLRQLQGVVDPDRTKPFSHSVHRPQYSVEDVDTTRLMKEQTRIRTMGAPKPVAIKGFRSTATLTAAAARAASEAATAEACSSSRPKNKVDRRETIETQKSSVPLKWACTDGAPVTSAYTAAFRCHPRDGPQMEKVVFKDCNVGLGSVNQHIYPASGNIFPVPLSYVTPSPCGGADGDARVIGDNTLMMSTNMLAYQDRAPEEAARAVAAAAEQTALCKSARNKSDTPLGKGGIQMGSTAQWASVYQAEYIPRRADLSSNKAMAAAVSGMFNGPTISWGKIAGRQSKQLSPAAAAAAAAAGGVQVA